MDNLVKKQLENNKIKEDLNPNNFIDFNFTTQNINKIVAKEKNVDKLIKDLDFQSNKKLNNGTTELIHFLFEKNIEFNSISSIYLNFYYLWIKFSFE